MGGFNTVVGFMFSFFIIAGIMLYSFTSFTEQINNQQEILESVKSMAVQNSITYDVRDAYYDGDRLKVIVENTGSNKLFFKEGSNYCLDVYINGNFVSSDNYGLYMSSVIGNYYFIDIGESAILDIKYNIDVALDIDVKVIACGNSRTEEVFDSNYYNWLDSDYKNRVSFTIQNSGGTNLKDNYFNIILNNSNFDFTKATQDNIKFLLPISENVVLDTNFDFYNQTLEDLSRYSNVVTLGVGSGVASDDPSNTQGVFFDALDFADGNDYSRVSPHQSLELEKEITYSAWVKWTGNGVGNHTIFRNGRDENVLSVINDGSANSGKVLFSLNIGGITREVYSNSILTSNWHLITSSYNGSLMELYIDTDLVGSLSVNAADVVFTSLSNQIGSANTVDFFNGSIDDLKILNIALNSSEVALLYSNNLKFRSLNYTVNSWDVVSNTASLNVKIPFIGNTENITIWLYYYLLGENYNQTMVGGATAGTPGTISNLAATRGNKVVDLTWSAPSQGDSAITSYTVEYGIGAFDNIFVDDATPGVTITGLTNLNLYQFRVYANNTQGAGSVSNTATATPTGTYYMTQDLATNLGIDGTANQGILPIALAQLSYGDLSVSTSACVGERSTMVNRIMGQEYTPTYVSQLELINNVTGVISVDGSSTSTTWRAILYEYNDVTGNVATLGTAVNTSIISGPDTLSLTFNNTLFNVTAGNRLKVVLDATNGGNKQTDLCYGVGTQSSFVFDRN